jgi:hypothetical protein
VYTYIHTSVVYTWKKKREKRGKKENVVFTSLLKNIYVIYVFSDVVRREI